MSDRALETFKGLRGLLEDILAPTVGRLEVRLAALGERCDRMASDIKENRAAHEALLRHLTEQLAILEEEELAALRSSLGEEVYARGRYQEAREIFDRVALGENFEDFLTLSAYERSIVRQFDGYDAVLSDVWGVIHNGVAATPAACDGPALVMMVTALASTSGFSDASSTFDQI